MHKPDRYFCDRCGTQIDPISDYRLMEKVRSFRSTMLSFGDSSYHKIIGEYCEECGEKIREYANIRRS
jgi:hypothetical protein